MPSTPSHHPQSPVLTSLLPSTSAFFPAFPNSVLAAFARPAASTTATATAAASAPAAAAATSNEGMVTVRLLDALAGLGMVTKVDLVNVLLVAARALHDEHAALTTAADDAAQHAQRAQQQQQAQQRQPAVFPLPGIQGMAGAAGASAAGSGAGAGSAGVVVGEAERAAKAKALQARGRALLQQLEQWAAAHPLSQRRGAAAQAGGPAEAAEEEARRAWSVLTGLSWCPVVKDAPEPGQYGHKDTAGVVVRECLTIATVSTTYYILYQQR